MKKLGFGLMRMPLLDAEDQTSFDYPKINEMVDAFIQNGFCYFDTAFVYHRGKSEEMVRKAIVDRHSRDKFKIATKLPIWSVKEKGDAQSLFDKQLSRCGVDFIDYYLLHCLDTDNFKKVKQFDLFAFGHALKKQGKIKNLGFSFHDNHEVLEEIFAYLKTSKIIMPDFVMLQINYIDWLNPNIASKKCYDIARKYGVPIMIMEPVKGGSLVNLPNDAIKLMKDYNSNASIASWAIRYALSLDGIIMVLSGMNTMMQLDDNMATVDNFKPLNNEEREIIKKVVDILNNGTAIGCTYCEYCLKSCPKNIPIHNYFQLYNEKSNNPKAFLPSGYYENLIKRFSKPSDCVLCGKCEKMCPQKLKIIDGLKEVTNMFEKKEEKE